MNLKANLPENVRPPRGVIAKFAVWFAFYTAFIILLDFAAGSGVPLQSEWIIPLTVAMVTAYLSRSVSQDVQFSNKAKFTEALRKAQPKNYDLALQTQTLVYFTPSNVIARLFNDVILVEIQGDTATITGEIAVVKRLQQELRQANVATSVE